jgi:hypothetical protein
MTNLSQIKEHADVVDSSGNHVGTVDHVEGNRIKLTRKDSPDGQHHYIDGQMVASIENGTVQLNDDYVAEEPSEDRSAGQMS